MLIISSGLNRINKDFHNTCIEKETIPQIENKFRTATKKKLTQKKK